MLTTHLLLCDVWRSFDSSWPKNLLQTTPTASVLVVAHQNDVTSRFVTSLWRKRHHQIGLADVTTAHMYVSLPNARRQCGTVEIANFIFAILDLTMAQTAFSYITTTWVPEQKHKHLYVLHVFTLMYLWACKYTFIYVLCMSYKKGSSPSVVLLYSPFKNSAKEHNITSPAGGGGRTSLIDL